MTQVRCSSHARSEGSQLELKSCAISFAKLQSIDIKKVTSALIAEKVAPNEFPHTPTASESESDSFDFISSAESSPQLDLKMSILNAKPNFTLMDSQPSIVFENGPGIPKVSTRQQLNKKLKHSLAQSFKRTMLRGDSVVSSILSPASNSHDSKKNSILSVSTVAGSQCT